MTHSITLFITLLISVLFDDSKCSRRFQLNNQDEINEHRNDIKNRVIDGSAADKNEFPWIVLISYSKWTGMATCGGSIVNVHWVITAAHCTDFIHYTHVSLSFGCHNINNWYGTDCRDYHYLTKDDRLFIHHNYVRGLPKPPLYQGYDIAMIWMKKAIHREPGLVDVGALDYDYVKPNEAVLAAGWGQTTQKRYGASVSDYLKKGRMQVVDSKTVKQCPNHGRIICCIQQEPSNAHPDDDPLGRSCKGDSGGPLMRKTAWGWKIIGIMSYSYVKDKKVNDRHFM